jgi:hypothetical protein
LRERLGEHVWASVAPGESARRRPGLTHSRDEDAGVAFYSPRESYPWYDVPPPEPTDRDIKSIVVHRLRENPYTRDDDITVDVKRDVVILAGTVLSSRAKRAAGDDAWDTRGVVDVSNQLTVATPD